MYDVEDTITAVASTVGGERGVVRISGPQTLRCLAALFPDIEFGTLERTSWLATTLRVQLAAATVELPVQILVWPTTSSYTRQVSAELHLSGNAVLTQQALQSLCDRGARLARPGEFTLRAFLAGRLDLTQAEAVLGVIEAQSERELNVALVQLAGGLSRPLNLVRDRLLGLLAHLEAGLDFVEEDIEFISKTELLEALADICEPIELALTQLQQRWDYQELPRVALFGMPNAGKSSLLNAVAADQVALVSPQQGTTRDYLQFVVTIRDCDFLWVDTAGIDAQARLDSIDRLAQQKTSEQIDSATLRILCIDASRDPCDWEREQLSQSADDRLIVSTKVDLSTRPELPGIATSSHSGLGIEALKQQVYQRWETQRELASGIAGTSTRCRGALQSAWEAVQRAEALVQFDAGEELVAAEIREALDQLGLVVGAVYTEDVLDQIFSRFCIGK